MPDIEDLKFSSATASNGRIGNFETGSVVLLDAALRLALGVVTFAELPSLMVKLANNSALHML
jgi:hypothetical protein